MDTLSGAYNVAGFLTRDNVNREVIIDNAHIDILPGAYDVPGFPTRINVNRDANIIDNSDPTNSSGNGENETFNAQVVDEQVHVLNEIGELRNRIVRAQVVSVEEHPVLPLASYYLPGKKKRWIASVGFFFLLAVVGVVIALSFKRRKHKDKSHPVDRPLESQPAEESNESLSTKECFTSGESLLDAIESYLANNSSSNDTDITIKYGWPIGTWCVSLITDFSHLLNANRNPAVATFNEALAGWDVSNGQLFDSMFSGSRHFNQNISRWNTSSATSLSSMFAFASRFNQTLSSWNVSLVTDMSYMFWQATDFDGNLSSWDVSRVTNMASMFSTAVSFNSDISGWQVSNVMDMSFMLEATRNFNQNIGQWNTSSLSAVASMFTWATRFNQDISGWSMSKVTTTKSMLEQATAFNQDISKWDLSAVEDAQSMFRGATSFCQNLCAWRTHFMSTTMTDDMFMGTNCTSQAVNLLMEPFPFFCESCAEQ